MSQNTFKILDTNLKVKKKSFKRKVEFPFVVISNQTLDLVTSIRIHKESPKQVLFRNCVFDGNLNKDNVRVYRNDDPKEINSMFVFEDCTFKNIDIDLFSVMPYAELFGKAYFKSCKIGRIVLGGIKGIVYLEDTYITSFETMDRISYDKFVISEDSKIECIDIAYTEENSSMSSSKARFYDSDSNTKNSCLDYENYVVTNIGKYIILNNDRCSANVNFDPDKISSYRYLALDTNINYDPSIEIPEPKVIKNIDIKTNRLGNSLDGFGFYLSRNIELKKLVNDVIVSKDINRDTTLTTVDIYPIRLNIKHKKITPLTDIIEVLFREQGFLVPKSKKYL